MTEPARTQSRQPSEAQPLPADPIFDTIQILEPEKPKGFRHQVSSKVRTSHWSSLFSCIAPPAPSSSADDAKDAEEQEDEQDQASSSAKWTWGTKKVRAEDLPCVMFVGLDGSGKTTIIHTLLEEARRLKVEEQKAKEEARRAARNQRHAQRQQNGADGAAGAGAASSRDTSVRDSQPALSKAVTGVTAVTDDRGTTRTGYQTDGVTEDGEGEGGEGGGMSEKARRARDAIQPPPPAPSDRGMLYAVPEGVLRHECVLMDTPGGFFQRRRYLCGLQLATAVVLCVDAADEGRFPVVRDFFAQHVLPEVCRRHLPLLLLATKRDVCDWGAAEDVALDLDLAILMAHVAAPWTAAHVVGGQLGPLREPLTWLLQQSTIVDHLWHSWPSSAPVLLHYQQANARYAVGMASKKAVELFHGDDEDGSAEGGAGAGAAGGEGGAGGYGRMRVAAGPLPALAPSGSVHISAVPSLAPLGSTPQPSVGMPAPA